MKITIKAGDFFCGAGGGTSGLLEACQELGLCIEVDAVNHWSTAIETHSLNHPNVRHWCENLDSVWPRKIVPGAHLHFAVFAPECTHHARARGAKPMNEQSRATAWCVIRWSEEVNIENILVENVPEFVNWGPLYADDHPDEKKRGRPIPEKKGLFFKNWVKQLKIRGYKVDYRVLNSAYFGAATARKRLFVQAKKQGRITWPEPTHDPIPETQGNLFGAKPKFVAARNIIDWDLQGESIYNRDRPLAENTMNRIYAGIKKFSGLPFIMPPEGYYGGNQPRDLDEPMQTITSRGGGHVVQPFLVILRNNCDARSLDDPAPTICANGGHLGLCEPFVVKMFGTGEPVKSVDEPIPTITTGRNRFYLAKPFLMKYHGSHKGRGDGAQRVYPLDEPMKTLDTQPRFAVIEPRIEPYLVSYKGQDEAKSLENPLGALTTRDRFGLCQPFLTKFYGGHDACSLDWPLPTVTANFEHFGLCQAFAVPVTHAGGPERCIDLAKPLPTVTTAKRGELALVKPFLVEYYGNGGAVGVDSPLPTITTRDRFALVHPQYIDFVADKGEVVGVLDVLFRMLQPHELSAAMGFRKSYSFCGNREAQIRQIGNAIEVNTMKALCKEMLKGYAPRRKKAQKKQDIPQNPTQQA